MIYKVSALNVIPTNASYTSYSLSGKQTTSYAQPNYIEVEATILVLDADISELKDIETFEQALKGPKILDGAPSYEDLLRKYHPEYFL